ncbi:MAG: hypothetical protein JJE55_15430 [Flavobacteriaceae bacterium]|nr:hypothetical protein [Flavobacteriaceae bacterium]
MKRHLLQNWALICAFFLLPFFISYAQVGINTTTPANGALLDISSSNKGFLMTRVALTGTDDVTTITPSATTGLMVYNTVTAGALPVQVRPGFYYWSGSQWRRFYNQGYALKYNQVTQVTANNNSSIYTPISDLDTGIITIPYSGTYQIRAEAFYAAGTLADTDAEGVGQASVSLFMGIDGGTPVKVKESYVTSTSKRINGTTINSLAQNVTISYTVDLDVEKTYQFDVRGREWQKTNVTNGTFGKDTGNIYYSGSLGTENAQRGSLSILLLKQF